MNKILFFVMLISLGCGGKLSQEERQRLHEGMATQDIKRVSDAQLQEAALNYGSVVMKDVESIDKMLTNRKRIDSMASARGIKIYSLTPDHATLKEIEQKLIEAYIAGTDAGVAVDNLQKLGDDSLLFTRPVFRIQSDGSQQFVHAIGIRMSKRTVVLSMPQP
jgi:Flp pilus assembly protein TadD